MSPEMESWYDYPDGDGNGVPHNHGVVQSLDSWQNDSYWGENQPDLTQPEGEGQPGGSEENRPLNRWLQDQPNYNKYKGTWNLNSQASATNCLQYIVNILNIEIDFVFVFPY